MHHVLNIISLVAFTCAAATQSNSEGQNEWRLRVVIKYVVEAPQLLTQQNVHVIEWISNYSDFYHCWRQAYVIIGPLITITNCLV